MQDHQPFERIFEGRRALVTGSTSGIGLAIARALAARGCAIMFTGLGGDADQHHQLAEDIACDCGVKTGFLEGDIGDPAFVKTLVAETDRQLGGLNILVNNAGMQNVQPITEFPDQTWESIIGVNLSAAFYTIKSALPLMRQAGFGRIINIASVQGLIGSIDKAAYVSSKHGLVGLTKVVALETAAEEITCNAICPGWTRTPLIEPQITARRELLGGVSEAEAVHDLLAEKQPSGDFVKPEELASLAVFLCSDAARQMTGVSLPVDGGWTAQ